EEYHAPTQAGGEPQEMKQLRLLQIFVDLCQTVAYAHSRKVLHRDLKPENVMLGSYGETLVLDWGLAKVLGQPEVQGPSIEETAVQLTFAGVGTETIAGSIMGSPFYMAPETAAGLNDAVDERSDVYLLGATLYEILTNQPPRSGKGPMKLIQEART